MNPSLTFARSYVGYAYAFASAFLSALNVLMYKYVSPIADPSVLAMIESVSLMAFFGVLAIQKLGYFRRGNVKWFIAGALAHGVGSIMYFVCIQALTPSLFSLLTRLQVVFVYFFGWIAFSDRLKTPELFGAAMILIGSLLAMKTDVSNFAHSNWTGLFYAGVFCFAFAIRTISFKALINLPSSVILFSGYLAAFFFSSWTYLVSGIQRVATYSINDIVTCAAISVSCVGLSSLFFLRSIQHSSATVASAMRTLSPFFVVMMEVTRGKIEIDMALTISTICILGGTCLCYLTEKNFQGTTNEKN